MWIHCLGCGNIRQETLLPALTSAEYWKSFIAITRGLWWAYCETDATLAEINPLVITANHQLIALDGKMVIDDNALFRRPAIASLRDVDEDTEAEVEARKHGLAYIQLEGQIGCMVNGAGLAMATMDMIKLQGGEPANFLDIGGGAGADSCSSISDHSYRTQKSGQCSSIFLGELLGVMRLRGIW